jgi:hypothetical protein
MTIADGLAQVVVVRGNGWKITCFTDVDPPTGLWRDIEDNARWIASRCGA